MVDPRGRTVGIVSRRDLLRVGRLETVEGRSTHEWHLPDQVASDVMSSQIIAVAPNTSIAEAAGLMLDNQTHRVFIDAEHRLKGVLTTRDVMQAIVDVRLDAPIERYLSSPVETIANFEPLAAAGDGPSQALKERSEKYLETPPPEDWGGVYTMTSK